MLTFHKIVAGCETGEGGAWRAFLTDYMPVIVRLTRLYLPGAACPEQLWKDALRAMCGDNFGALRGFEHQSEREFLAWLRVFYLKESAHALDAGRDAQDLPEPTVTSIAALLKGAPLVHQEVLFLKLAGYSDATLEKIFRITPAVAQSSLARLKEGYGAALTEQEDAGLRPAAWLNMLHDLWNAKTDACPPLRLFIRIQDGQTGWQEKEPAERHVGECLHCLESWTALREMGYWRQAAPQVSPEQVDEFFSVLPLRTEIKKSKSLLKWLFG